MITMPPRLTADQRFERFIRVEESGCHTWTGYVDVRGYGRFHYEGKGIAAHRYAWFKHYGEWPPPWPSSGMEVNHTCHNSSCVNPLHLEILTHAANLAYKRMTVQTRHAKPVTGQHCSCCLEYSWNPDTLKFEPTEGLAALIEKRVELEVERRLAEIIPSPENFRDTLKRTLPSYAKHYN